MAYACNCLGISESTLKEALEKAAAPVAHEDIHRKLGGCNDNCCGNCRNPDADRLFSKIVNEHNTKTGKNNTPK